MEGTIADYDLVLKWSILNLNSRYYFYGINCDLSRKCYTIYCTNFYDAWIEKLNKEDIIAKATETGIEITNDETLDVLLQTFSDRFNEDLISESLTFEVETPIKKEDSIATEGSANITIHFQHDVEWSFYLSLASERVRSQILSMINIHQCMNQNFLMYKINKLESLIEAKDKYTLFLSENYKAINGEDLIKKYIHNNKADSEYLAKYNKERWDASIQSSYASMLRKMKYMKKSVLENIWINIIAAFNDKIPWRITSFIERCWKQNRDSDMKIQNDVIKSEILSEFELSESPDLEKESPGQFSTAQDEKTNIQSPKRRRARVGKLPKRRKAS